MTPFLTGAPARNSSSHPRVAAATVADVMRLPLTTVGQSDHVAAAAYLMKHAGTTALMVMDARTGQPAGIITQADVARAVEHGTRDPQTNVTDDDIITTAKIARAHLNEFPDYYTRLAKMEAEAEAEAEGNAQAD